MSGTGMTLTPIPNFGKLGNSLMTKKDILKLAIDTTTSIRKRTKEQGVDFRGTPFKNYTKPYAIRKGQSFVNLTGTSAGSRMLNSMKQTATGKKGFIYFGDSDKNNLAIYNSKLREFFEIGKDDEKMISKNYEALLRKKISKWERAK